MPPGSNSQTRYFLSLTQRLRIGFVLLMVIIIFLTIAILHHLRERDQVILFVGLVLLLLTIYKIAISPYIGDLRTQMEALSKASEDSIQASKMLIRRDLDLNRANDKLRELDEAKSNFISIVAHQLRTPLSSIKWTLNMILEDTLGSLTTEQRSFLMKCYESNERLIVLINDMLSADRVESGKLKYSMVPTSIFNLIDNILFEMTPMISKKKLKLTFENRTDDIPHVLIDTEKMRAALQNLLENSVKYTPEGGALTIGFKHIESFVEVWVRDTGIGIPQEEQDRIFTRLFRARNAIKVETGGSGLGLFITKGIVEKHGGKIWFESKVGEGSTFSFSIPAVK